MTDLFSLPQILGYIGVVTYVGAYLFRNDNHLKLGFSFSNIFWVTHYWMIGAQTAALTHIVITLRNLCSLDQAGSSDNKKAISAAVFTALFIGTGFVSWAGITTIMAIGCSVVATQAVFYLHGVRLRQTFFLIDIVWLAHAGLVDSIGGMIYAIGALVVNGYVIFKMVRENASNKEVIGIA